VPAHETDEAAMSPEGVQRRLQGIHPKRGDYDVPYHALYAVHQRVAATFNKGRVLLAGDSAHVNNPIGGMGMNGGIHDAMNLAEKLADIWFGRAGAEVLDRYTRPRCSAIRAFTRVVTRYGVSGGCTADAGPGCFWGGEQKKPGSRVCSAPLRAALRPGHALS